jgi:hypothetical protein
MFIVDTILFLSAAGGFTSQTLMILARTLIWKGKSSQAPMSCLSSLQVNNVTEHSVTVVMLVVLGRQMMMSCIVSVSASKRCVEWVVVLKQPSKFQVKCM